MWLDDLNELVDRLKKRIEQHRDVLDKNETATRYALIDPLLTALGWNLQDPGQVRTEYNPDGDRRRRSDYTMFTGGGKKKSQLVIEAKKLGTPISGEIIDQTITYCIREGIPYFAVTNGDDWEAYPTFREGHTRITEKRIVDFKLTDTAETTVMKMLWLWRGNFESESPTESVVPDRLASQRTATPAPQPAPTESPSSVQRPNRGTPLDEFNPKGKSLPVALLFQDGTEKNIDNWYKIQTSVVEWLVGTGRLTKADCPIRTPRGSFLVGTSPFKDDDEKSRLRTPQQIGNLFIDSHADSSRHVKNAIKILRARGVDPSDVRIVMRT